MNLIQTGFSKKKYLVNMNNEIFNGLNFLEGMQLMYPYPIFQCPLIRLVHLVHCIDEVRDQHHEHNQH